ncbi:dihydroxyacetone kinase phosphoryl donor subunit DhaM [Heyndrickxia vini]|uniref:phosphoenolpyruvate--glycerone phosphotransferase n=1 Tax=Heyndrickxia vini TaxID=1476025 RepID=A0ABX7DZX6_9BACI|nr:dihydroxyacetone kinase phosphoryl donor subunit DhaM [Heyndrickxia vini]QQZ08822.1 PTS-dependent dihydroxyacetone kinase phosphotransferase subunit DhaM [Heyndrickxia vini]
MNNVGIVLISHSSKIVEGIKDILAQVVNNVPIGTAGGTDENEIGTSIEKIVKAIEQVHNEKGVILLYDLGSAMMNAELANELTGYKNIKIAENIPLVEGAYIAAVESSIGNDIDKIIRSIRESF